MFGGAKHVLAADTVLGTELAVEVIVSHPDDVCPTHQNQ